MKEIKHTLKSLLSWSDRIGSDEIFEINRLLDYIEELDLYTKKDMEKAFIAGGKLSRSINNDSFEEFLKTIKTKNL